MQESTTAILFFSRSLNDEFKAKGFGFSFLQFQNLYRFLQRSSLRTLNHAGLEVFRSYSNDQQGNSFGERLANELRVIKSQGYESVIVVGNDTPELSEIDLEITKNALLQGQSVLGANKRGGVYLMAFYFDQIDLVDLQAVHWHSRSVFSQLSVLFSNPLLLEEKLDLNKPKDISALGHSSWLSCGIRSFLLKLLDQMHADSFMRVLYELSALNLSFRRGPPKIHLVQTILF